MGNYLHTFILDKKYATNRSRHGEAKRTHSLTHYLQDVGDMDSAHNKGLQVKDKDRYWFYSFAEPVISLGNIIALDKRAVT